MRKRNWSCYPAARGKSQSTRTKAAEGQRILLDQHDITRLDISDQPQKIALQPPAAQLRRLFSSVPEHLRRPSSSVAASESIRTKHWKRKGTGKKAGWKRTKKDRKSFKELMKKALLRVARAASRGTAVMVWFREKWNLTWAKRTRKRSSVSERSLVCCNARGEGTTGFNIQNPAWVLQGNACKPLVSTGKQTPNNGNLATRPLQHTKNKDPKRTQHSAHTFHTSTKENPNESFFREKHI